ncbi:TlpA disulfide reductase family protein [Streptomyces sp. NPDC004539]|uniref:TlpA family protein disulfide reductase n=1 Tax=Streptomyces sp. NPDC004539 TaxID=3154280 RepID=UPI0033B5BDAF
MSAASRASRRSNSVFENRPRSRRAVLTMAAGAVVGGLVLSACSSGGTSGGGGDTHFVMGTDGIARVKAGQRDAAPELSGKTVTGPQLDVASYKGKIVVLNVWGSWCSPCRAEAPGFQKVSESLKSQGVQFVGINTRDTNNDNALAFEKQMGVTYPSLSDPTGKLLLRFKKGTLNLQTIPSTLVIDREGKIAARSLSPLSEERLREMIAPVLAEKA